MLLIDPGARANLEASGVDTERLLERCLWADRYVTESLPDHVRTGLHLCRGNNRSSWMFEGSIDAIAEEFFALPYDAFLIEWDDAHRDGGFGALRHLPDARTAVLGIVNSKVGALEDEDALVARIHEAAQHVRIDQLALSPQCGFASSHEGNLLTEDEQWRKLELVGRAADRVWPR